nr:glutamine--tRNA ligase-like [Tanacetum cinerariifolium]
DPVLMALVTEELLILYESFLMRSCFDEAKGTPVLSKLLKHKDSEVDLDSRLVQVLMRWLFLSSRANWTLYQVGRMAAVIHNLLELRYLDGDCITVTEVYEVIARPAVKSAMAVFDYGVIIRWNMHTMHVRDVLACLMLEAYPAQRNNPPTAAVLPTVPAPVSSLFGSGFGLGLCRYAFPIKCTKVVLSEDKTNVVEIEAEYDLIRRLNQWQVKVKLTYFDLFSSKPMTADGFCLKTRCKQAVLHWVANHLLRFDPLKVKVGLFNKLFKSEAIQGNNPTITKPIHVEYSLDDNSKPETPILIEEDEKLTFEITKKQHKVPRKDNSIIPEEEMSKDSPLKEIQHQIVQWRVLAHFLFGFKRFVSSVVVIGAAVFVIVVVIVAVVVVVVVESLSGYRLGLPDVVHLDHLYLDDKFKRFVSSVVVIGAAVFVIVVVIVAVVVVVVVESLVRLAKLQYYRS